MRFLNGQELAGYIKERQAKQVRRLIQSDGITPKLAIVVTIDSSVIDTYISLKQKYGADILVEVEVHRVKQAEVEELIAKLNKDPLVHGIIVQLPLQDPLLTEEVVNLVAKNKDVDGLGKQPDFSPATPLAITWLISAYNIELAGKQVLLVGYGRLVGAPLKQMLMETGIEPKVVDETTEDLKSQTLEADVIITATGQPGLLTSDMIKQNAVIIDAGVASEGGKTAGDVEASVYSERIDLTITPLKGGVGPVTVCALFDNVIQAAQSTLSRIIE
jgi:methylenetetrahydrofolate dehydrogenase (NADP+)/methenyltetrahydrofolate cyclohydrolase